MIRNRNGTKTRATFIGMLILLMLSIYDSTNAAWQGPVEVVVGTWGNSSGQFGIEYGDTNDSFPRSFGVTKAGKVVIADPINEKLHTFNSDGSFFKDIDKPVARKLWPYSVDAINGECVVVGYVEFTHTFNVARGELIGVANNMGGANYINDDCSQIYSGGKAGWKVYSPTGQLIKTYTERPLELGQVTQKRAGSNTYKITVKYPDKEWSYIGKGALPSYIRDLNGNLYGYGHKQVVKFDGCGRELGRLTMPASRTEEVSRGEQLDPLVTVLEEYGAPVIAPNGDVYTWKRTPDKYSIVKWTWVDDATTPPPGPDAPTNVKIMLSTTGLYLTWTASPQDPGCVTGYEISRADTAGGIYSVIATTAKGVLKYNDTTATVGTTYYYKIRAVSGTDYSPYTNEVSGKR